MVNRKSAAALVVICAIAAANLVSACVRNDDNDAFATPTPPPAATPEPLHKCQIVWTEQNATDPAGIDALVLDGPRDQWINGVATLATDAAAGFVYYFLNDYAPDPTTKQLDLTQAIAFSVGGTADTFTISAMTINGTATGENVDVMDTMNHVVYGLDTAGAPDPTTTVGTVRGTTFSGPINDYSGTTVSLGNGMATATITSVGSFSLGGFGSYAACYDIAQ